MEQGRPGPLADETAIAITVAVPDGFTAGEASATYGWLSHDDTGSYTYRVSNSAGFARWVRSPV